MKPPQDNPRSELRGTLPWSRSCLVCGEENPRGFRLRSRVEGGVVMLDYTPRETDVGWRRLVHGGIAMTLVDEVMTWAAILAAGRACVAAEMTTRLLAPLRVGQSIRAEGRVLSARSKLILTEGLIVDAAGAAIVRATGKYMPMASAEAALSAGDFVHSSDALDLSHVWKP